MIPVRCQLFCDNESLFEYERLGHPCPVMDTQCLNRRLVALERKKNPMRNDAYYEGLGDMYLSMYKDFHEFLWKLPFHVAQEYLYYREHSLYVKGERFNGWMDLICQFPPSLIVAACFLDRFSISLLRDTKGFLDFEKIYLSQFKYTVQPLPDIPDLKYFVQEAQGLNDLHIHLNGTTETDVLWGYILQNPNRITQSFMEVYSQKESVRKQVEQICADFTPERLFDRILKAKELRSSLVKRIAQGQGLEIHDEGLKEDPFPLRFLWGILEERTSKGEWSKKYFFVCW